MLADHPVEEGQPLPEKGPRTGRENILVDGAPVPGEGIEDLGLHPPKLSPSFGQATAPAEDRPVGGPEVMALGLLPFLLLPPCPAAPATDRRRNPPPQKGQGLPGKPLPDGCRRADTPVKSVQGPAGQSKKGGFGV